MRRYITCFLVVLLTLSVLSGCTASVSDFAATQLPATPAVTEAATPAGEPVTEEPSRTVTFTDSLGRAVEVPAEITNIAVTGTMAQIVLFALCPDKLAGVASAWDAVAELYLDAKYFKLPEFGQLYGGKGEMNMETLLASNAQIVIDVGEPKGSATEDLDALQEQTGIPFVHVTATTATMGDAYRKLGELLNMEVEAETLATFYEKTYARTYKIANSVEKANIVYCLGENGLNVIAKTSYHAEVIDLLANNMAVVDDPSSKGTGNEVDMEQLLIWNPDIIIFSAGSIYDSVGSDPAWQQLKAIREGNYYEVPYGPHNWMSFPPSVQRLLGMMWLSKLLYPETAQYDLAVEVTSYYKLFYHCDLTQEQYAALMTNSIAKLQ